MPTSQDRSAVSDQKSDRYAGTSDNIADLEAAEIVAQCARRALRPQEIGRLHSWLSSRGGHSPLPDWSSLSVADRLKVVVSGFKMANAEELFGRSEKSVKRYLDGADMPFAFISNVSKATGMPIEWLATGQPVPAGEAGGQPGVYQPVPMLGRDADLGPVAIDQAWFQRLCGLTGDFSAVRAVLPQSDVLDPAIRRGDVLLIDTSVRTVVENGLYAVEIAGHPQLRRINVRADGAFIVIGDNTTQGLQDVILPADTGHLVIAGRVVWIGRPT